MWTYIQFVNLFLLISNYSIGNKLNAEKLPRNFAINAHTV